MINCTYVTQIQSCLDDYMLDKGKTEIDEIEANRVLAETGLMTDDNETPGEPLRALLRELRDTNLLPKNIRQSSCVWIIKHSKMVAKMQQLFFF